MSKLQVSGGRPPGINRSTDAESDGLSVGNVCHVLQNRRRRLVLNYLQKVDGPTRTSDLAEAVAAIENDTTTERLDHSERQRVYIALHQVHLPTLDDAGVVSYDGDRGTVEALATADELYESLERIEDAISGSDGTGNSARVQSDTSASLDRWRPLIVGTIVLAGFLVGIVVGTVL